MERKRYSRRDFLRISAITAGSLTLAGCASKAETIPTLTPITEKAVATSTLVEEIVPTPSPPEGHIVVAYRMSEFTEEYAQEVMDQNPGITVELIEAEDTRLMAIVAAGNPPDIIRSSLNQTRRWHILNMLFNLTPYLEASTVIDMDDLLPANNAYRAASKTEWGSGNYYGLVKDFSQDFAAWINPELLSAGGVAVPDDTKNLTFQELKEIGEKAAVFEGDRVAVWGTTIIPWAFFHVSKAAAELGESVYLNDFSKIDLVENETSRMVLQYIYDIAKERLTDSVISPAANDWRGRFPQGIQACMQDGYWFGAKIRDTMTTDQAKHMPTLSWTGKNKVATAFAVGAVMSSGSKYPDAVWKVFEYFIGGRPADDRAQAGWGIPAFASRMDMLPNENPIDQQRLAVVRRELEQDWSVIEMNPYINHSAVSDPWLENMELVLKGNITFDEAVANTEAAANEAIKEGIERSL